MVLIACGTQAARRWLPQSLALTTVLATFCRTDSACSAVRCIALRNTSAMMETTRYSEKETKKRRPQKVVQLHITENWRCSSGGARKRCRRSVNVDDDVKQSQDDSFDGSPCSVFVNDRRGTASWWSTSNRCCRVANNDFCSWCWLYFIVPICCLLMGGTLPWCVLGWRDMSTPTFNRWDWCAPTTQAYEPGLENIVIFSKISNIVNIKKYDIFFLFFL